MTQYMPRSAWTSAPRGGAQLTGTKLLGVACHWPGTTTNAYGVESADKVAARLRGWWDFHVNTRGWSDIGYNMAVDQAGRVWDLRGLERVGAHAASDSNPDANHEWVGVLHILGDQEPPTGAMVTAFQDFRYKVFLPRWPGRTRLTGHGRAPGVLGAQTSCPGPFVAGKITDGTLAQPPGTSPGDDDVTVEELLGTTINTGQGPFKVATLLANAALLPAIFNAPDDADVDRIAAAVVAKLPAGSPVDVATVKQGVREVLLEGVAPTPLPPA